MGDGADGSPVLPEFTRSLRGFAAAGALGSRDHDRVFAPLLAARKAAARVETIDGQVAAFDAQRLSRALEETLATIAAERVPRDGGDRRALAARLRQLAAPAFAALDAVASAAARLRSARAAERAEPWREWVASVQAMFDGTDRFWMDFHASLGSPPAKRRRLRKGFVRLLTFVAMSASVGAGTLGAQHVTIRVSGVRPESLLAHGFDVVGREGGATLVVADSAERTRMERLGWRGTVVAGPTSAALQVAPNPRVYRSYDDPVRGVLRFIDSLAQNNPRVSVDTLGRSYEGRPMLAVKVGPKGDSPARPNVLFMATYHAREWAATEMALRLITYLASAPGGNSRVDSLVQARDIWILPVANPDGYQYTFSNDRLWRKTRSPQENGAFGVDMNRNHSQRWGLDNSGSSPVPFSDIFRGPSPASEIEVRNIEAFHAAHPPVLSVSYHTYAGLLIFPPGAVYGERPADLPVYQTLAGTNLRSAILDRLPASARTFSSPSSGWMLYTTNGDYNDWASVKYGTVTFTPELTSGYTSGFYYGFEFADDETQLKQLFDDNLPFALDVIESARDPLGYVSATTLGHSDRIVLESVSPDVRVTVPSSSAPTATIVAGSALGFRIDSGAGGRYTRRLISTQGNRPVTVRVNAAGFGSMFSVLEINGAERSETGWTATGFQVDSLFAVAGKYSWFSASTGELRSRAVPVPSDVDTVSLVFWTRYLGSGFDQNPYAQVLLSTDGGSNFQPVLRLQGSAPAWYPERVTVGGVKGKQVVFKFVPAGMPWSLDEIAIVAHHAFAAAAGGGTIALRPSENPVHRSVVYFPWPFNGADGSLQAYDFSGRLVWKTTVVNRATARWDLGAARVANGVYVVVARSGDQSARLKLYVVRDGS
jgi:zinc carboxypeptidase